MTSKQIGTISSRFSRADLTLLGELSDRISDKPEHEHLKKGIARMFEKLERAAERVSTDRGLHIGRFLDIAKEELGERLILPPAPNSVWYQTRSRHLRSIGVKTVEDARAVCIYAARFIKPGFSINVDRLIYNASEYLALARAQGMFSKGPLPIDG